MGSNPAQLFGSLKNWPKKTEMAEILRKGGLEIDVGAYSITVRNCSHFIFQEYGGDFGEPVIEADADDVEAMIRDAALVSDALKRSGIGHRFEIYDADNRLVKTFEIHYDE